MIARTFLPLAVFCAGGCVAVAQTPTRFDVKPGQWETTISGQTTGAPPIPQEMLDKMSPDQRAKMEAMMKARGIGAPSTTVTKNCVHPEDLEKPFASDAQRKSCKQTLIASTTSKQEVRMECEEAGGKQTGTIKFEAVDSGTVKGTLQMTMTNGARTMNMNYTYASKWLGPVCTEPSKTEIVK